MVSVFRPDTGDDLLFDRDLNVNGVAFLLVFFVALLVRDLFTVGNLVRRAMLLRHLFAMRNATEPGRDHLVNLYRLALY